MSWATFAIVLCLLLQGILLRTKVTEGIQELSRRRNSCKTKRFFKSPITNSQPLYGADLGRSGEAGECKYEKNILFRAQLTLEEKTLLKATQNTSLLINRIWKRWRQSFIKNYLKGPWAINVQNKTYHASKISRENNSQLAANTRLLCQLLNKFKNHSIPAVIKNSVKYLWFSFKRLSSKCSLAH